MVNTILFDLDGTLLPMDQDTFIKAYFGLLAQHLAPYGYDGALKLTTAKYFSAKDENGYDGVGIEPTVTEELSAEASEYNIYELPDAKDNQLAKALIPRN